MLDLHQRRIGLPVHRYIAKKNPDIPAHKLSAAAGPRRHNESLGWGGRYPENISNHFIMLKFQAKILVTFSICFDMQKAFSKYGISIPTQMQEVIGNTLLCSSDSQNGNIFHVY